MGWMYTHRDKGQSNLDWFRREFCPGDLALGKEPRLLDVATKNGVAYGAWQDDDGQVSALVILTNWVPKDYFNFGYKAMEESMGPCEVDCPERIFNLLTPLPAMEEGEKNTTLSYAHSWRESVRERIAARKARAKVSYGDKVRFASPLTFTSGAQRQILTWIKGSMFKDERGSVYTIPSWRDRYAYEVVS